MTKISALMIDLSGTVHVGDSLLPGVKEAITRLRNHQVPLMFVTNTSKESKASLISRLRRAGLQVEQVELFTSLTAARQLVETDKLRPRLMLLEEDALTDFSDLDLTHSQEDCVVVGLAPSCFNYQMMDEAFRLVKGGARLLAINKSRYFKSAAGLSLGTGAFVSALEFSTDVKAQVVGKPEPRFFHLALSHLGPDSLNAGEVLMVGDDVRDDVLGAQAAGFQGALVRTGKYTVGDEDEFDSKPDFVFDNLTEVADFMIGQLEVEP